MTTNSKIITKPLRILAENLAVQNNVPFECYTYDISILNGYLVVEYHEQPSKKKRNLNER